MKKINADISLLRNIFMGLVVSTLVVMVYFSFTIDFVSDPGYGISRQLNGINGANATNLTKSTTVQAFEAIAYQEIDIEDTKTGDKLSIIDGVLVKGVRVITTI